MLHTQARTYTILNTTILQGKCSVIFEQLRHQGSVISYDVSVVTLVSDRTRTQHQSSSPVVTLHDPWLLEPKVLSS